MSNRLYHVVLMQDDPFQGSDFSHAITKALGNVELEKLSCEVEFLDRYEQKPNKMPDLFVLDLMVEWQARWVSTQRTHDPNLPAERAGVRCLNAIRKYDRNVPVFIYTVIDTDTLDQSVFDERKTFLRRKETTDERLIELIRRVLLAA